MSGFVSIANAQITGTVFRDYNGNGTKESTESLIAGIQVKAYNTTGAQCGTTQTTTSASAPNYSLSGCTGAVRVEFSIPATGCQIGNTVDYSGLSGTTYGSSVQFYPSGASATANFALFYPGEYVTNTNPTVFTPMQWNGDPSVAAVGAMDGFYGFPYNNVQLAPAPAQKAVLSALGSLYGVAYSRQAQKVFTSAFLKRHVGLGPLGSGGIYLINPTGATMSVSNFFDMDNPSNPLLATASTVTAIPTNNTTGTPAYGSGTSYNVSGLSITYPAGGLGVIGVNGAGGRILSTAVNTGSNDPAAFGQIGKVSLGDLDISDDGKFLFVTNLYDRKLYRLELDNASNPTKVNATQNWALPSISCNLGVLRPWAVKYHRGSVFVGAVCTGENSGASSDLDGYVFELTNATGAGTINATPVLTFPLDFDRGTASSENETFLPWRDTMPSIVSRTWNSQPMFTDIEVDIDGSLIMGFRDRNGDQVGHFNRELTGTTLRDARAVGEILRAYKNPTTCTFEFESNGKEGASSSKAATAGAGNGGGPGGGEFYYQDNFYNLATNQNATNHVNTAMGALALIPGLNQVMTTAMDPATLWGGGVSIFNNTTGQNPADYHLYVSDASNNDGTMSKANGLGDIELLSELAPIEIGNRVWLDTDNDGVQDAGEAGISGVTVKLLKGTTEIGSAVTDGNGNYYFSSATGTSTGSVIYGITQLMPNMAYMVRFPATTTVAATTYNLTTANSATGTDLIDSDAAATGDAPILATDIPISGANNHTFDVGYTAAPVVACVGNLIDNSSFETGDFTGWTISAGTTGDDVLLNSLAPGPFNLVVGNYYAVIANYTDDGAGTPIPNLMYQEFPVTAGTNVNLMVNAGTHNPALDQKLFLQFMDASNTVLSEQFVDVDKDVDDAPASFQKYTLTGTAPAGTTKVRAKLYDNGNTGGTSFKSDEWCLTTTPPVCTQPTFTINAVQPTCASPTGSISIGTITGPDSYTFNYDDMGTYVAGVLGVNGTATNGASVASGLSAGTYTVQLFKSTDNTCISNPNQTITLNAATGCGGGGQPDLEITKVADKATVVSGNTISYTITLKNVGTASATGVKVKDAIPSGLTYVSSVPSQGTYTSSTGIWDVGTIAQGATLTLTITVTVN